MECAIPFRHTDCHMLRTQSGAYLHTYVHVNKICTIYTQSTYEKTFVCKYVRNDMCSLSNYLFQGKMQGNSTPFLSSAISQVNAISLAALLIIYAAVFQNKK